MIRKIGYVVLLCLFVASITPLVLGTIYGPTVLYQDGLNETEGLGRMSPAIFHSMRKQKWPHVSDRRPGWFWGRTPAKPGEWITAFDASHLVAVRCDPAWNDLKRWFVWPTWLPPAALAVLGLLILVAGRVRLLLVPIPPGQCRHCGYDLTGNVSGVCPECGDAL
jgi:hypothetical protein